MWNKIKLYIISLWLLFFLIIFKEFKLDAWQEGLELKINVIELLKTNILSVLSFLLLILGVLFLINLRYKVKGSLNLPKRITKIKNLNYEHLTFLTTYIIPFICFELDDVRNTIIFLFLLIVIGAIYVKTNLFYSNPTLALLGYQIYQVDTVTDSEMILITQGELKDGESFADLKLDESVFYAKLKTKPKAYEQD